MEIALWFHDAIHEVRRGDNEQNSAQWAVRALSAAGLAADAIERVREMILATRHAVLPAAGDQSLLVDIDLSILAAEWSRFAEYEAQVRMEYGWVPTWLYRYKRRALLRGFLRRPAIYSTMQLRAEHEARARRNIERSLGQ